MVTPSLEGWPTNAKESPSPHELRLAPLDTNPVFQCLGENISLFFSPTPTSWKLGVDVPLSLIPQILNYNDTY